MLNQRKNTVIQLIILISVVIGSLIVFYHLGPGHSSVMPVESQPLASEINYHDLDPAMKEMVNHLFSKAIANGVNSLALSLNSQVHLAPFLAPHAPLGPICQIYSAYITHAR